MSAGDDGSVENLKQRLAMIVDACGQIQSALRTAEDRTDGAMISLAHTTEGSGSDEITSAFAALGMIKQGIEDYVAAAATAAEHITAYAATR